MIFFVPCQNSKLINVISKWKLLSKLVFEQYAKKYIKEICHPTVWWSKIKQHAQLLVYTRLKDPLRGSNTNFRYQGTQIRTFSLRGTQIRTFLQRGQKSGHFIEGHTSGHF